MIFQPNSYVSAEFSTGFLALLKTFLSHRIPSEKFSSNDETLLKRGRRAWPGTSIRLSRRTKRSGRRARCTTPQGSPSTTTRRLLPGSWSWNPRMCALTWKKSPRPSTSSRTSRAATSPSWSSARSSRTLSTRTSRRPRSPSWTAETPFASLTRDRASKRRTWRLSTAPRLRPKR